MRHMRSGKKLLAAVLLHGALLVPLQAQKVPVVERHLTNGMRLLLVERHDDPSIAGGWVAHVGSSNERLGITGIAHLFEHMMFKGTPTIGTKDYQKDLEIMAAQERVRDEMRQEERQMRAGYRRGAIDDLTKPENQTARYRELAHATVLAVANRPHVTQCERTRRVIARLRAVPEVLRAAQVNLRADAAFDPECEAAAWDAAMFDLRTALPALAATCHDPEREADLIEADSTALAAARRFVRFLRAGAN